MTVPLCHTTLTPWQLGASLYMPAMRPDLADIANGHKLPGLRSMIICTEDAVAAHDLERGLRQLRASLGDFAAVPGKLRFIRARNPDVLCRLLELPGIANIDGFVLPKFNEGNCRAYLQPLAGSPFRLMPTLETGDTFDAAAMAALRDELLRQGLGGRILLLRIGGNDLMNLMGIRRPRRFTVYQTPLAATIAQLVAVFKPYGFQLSAPVFEYLDDPATLRREIAHDLAYGLTGKTAIHPGQIAAIESCYAVSRDDYQMAARLAADGAPAVFKMHNAMCETATHQRWAQAILERRRLYGLMEDEGEGAGLAVGAEG